MEKSENKRKINEKETPIPAAETKKEPFIEWSAPEFEYHAKSVSWYWLTLIIAIILISLSIWQENFLFAVFVVIAWLVLVYFGDRKPLTWRFKIDKNGIGIGENKFYAFDKFEGFDIHESADDYQELILKTKTRLAPILRIRLPISEKENIIKFISNFLSKEEYNDSLVDSLSKLIKF